MSDSAQVVRIGYKEHSRGVSRLQDERPGKTGDGAYEPRLSKDAQSRLMEVCGNRRSVTFDEVDAESLERVGEQADGQGDWLIDDDISKVEG